MTLQCLDKIAQRLVVNKCLRLNESHPSTSALSRFLAFNLGSKAWCGVEEWDYGAADGRIALYEWLH